MSNWPYPRIVAHRGGGKLAPENTLAAIDVGARYGHTMIEFDAKLSKEEAVEIATSLWNEINLMNLKENILPTRERASLIMTKSANHSVNQVRLRK
jgi:hypothetical protein